VGRGALTGALAAFPGQIYAPRKALARDHYWAVFCGIIAKNRFAPLVRTGRLCLTAPEAVLA
jgi:hypothetical protein